jgi:hypothetical protein
LKIDPNQALAQNNKTNLLNKQKKEKDKNEQEQKQRELFEKRELEIFIRTRKFYLLKRYSGMADKR